MKGPRPARKGTCPFLASCHFPRLETPTASDHILRMVYCGGAWTHCSIHALLVHGHEASDCLWPDGEVKAAELTAG